MKRQAALPARPRRCRRRAWRGSLQGALDSAKGGSTRAQPFRSRGIGDGTTRVDLSRRNFGSAIPREADEPLNRLVRNSYWLEPFARIGVVIFL